MAVLTGQHDTPNFFNASMAQLDELTKWIERRADGVAPWVARFHLNGALVEGGECAAELHLGLLQSIIALTKTSYNPTTLYLM